MGVNRSIFPTRIWDGAEQARATRLNDSGSEIEDHDQIVSEIIAVQDYIINTLSSGGDPYSLETDSSVFLGSPVYINVSNKLQLGQANNQASARVVGFSTSTVGTSFSATFVTEGKLTRSDWSIITGTTLLSPGDLYFLSADTPGRMINSPPGIIGDFVVILGRAISPTEFDIEIQQPIKL